MAEPEKVAPSAPGRPAPGRLDPTKVDHIGPYEIVRFIAEGGMAWVFETRHPRLDGRLAIKVLKPEASAGELFKRFIAEASLLSEIDHPNLIKIFDLGHDDALGCDYYTMTLADGPPLDQAGVLPWREAVDVFRRVLDGLAALHDKGIIHRDIKPANILTFADGRPVLADLGIARNPKSAGLTRAGTIMGTAAYMSPEQAAGRSVGPRSDLFSIGMSLYRVIHGRSVYESVPDLDHTNSQSILFHLAELTATNKEVEFDFASDIPPGVATIIKQVCRFSPDERYDSASSLRDALAEVLVHPDIGPDAPTIRVAAPIKMLDPANVKKIDRYPVLRFIAEGGMGWVFEVEDPKLPERRLALKALKPTVANSDEFWRFRAEAEILARIEHPNLLSIYDIGVDEETGTSFFTMNFVDAPPLSHRSKMEVDEALDVFDGLLGALGALHEYGIVHRDIKPSNVLVDQKGRAILADLGIARDTNTASSTKTGLFMGTALYASPEQAQGGFISFESDVFSAGLCLYTILTGKSVYSGAKEVDSKNETSILFYLAKLEHSKSELPFNFPNSIPEPIIDVIRRACRFDQNQRYADAEEMRKALEIARHAKRRLPWRRWQKMAAAAVLVFGVPGAFAYDQLMGLGMTERLVSNVQSQLTELFGTPTEDPKVESALATLRDELSGVRGQLAGLLDTPTFGVGEVPSQERCGALPSAALRACEDSLDELKSADRYVERREVDRATESLAALRDSLGNALRIQQSWLSDPPRPPVVTRKIPDQQELTFYRNEQPRLRVEVEDPNEFDEVTYTWFVDDQEMTASTASLVYGGTEAALVLVRATDLTGRSTEASWQLSPGNRKPQLSMRPAAREFELETGETVEFNLTARDPDDDELEVAFKLGNQRVKSGTRYTFRADKPGQYVLTAFANDGAGGLTELKRTITVTRASDLANNTRTETVRPALSDDEGPGGADVSSGPEERGIPAAEAAQWAMTEYEQAYEAQDIARLESLWIMNRDQRDAMASMFDEMKSIEVEIEIQDADVQPGGKRVLVVFDQKVEAQGNRGIIGGPAARMTATLISLDAKSWQISSILPKR